MSYRRAFEKKATNYFVFVWSLVMVREPVANANGVNLLSSDNSCTLLNSISFSVQCECLTCTVFLHF